MSIKKNILIPLLIIFVCIFAIVLYNNNQIKEINNLSFVGDWSAKELLAAGTCNPSTHNVKGWFYAYPIGPISLNCGNCDTNGDGVIDNSACGNVGASIADYGVNINDDKTLSGYAWSPAIGPISFNKNEICASSVCQATDFPVNNTNIKHSAQVKWVESGTAKIIGWARALGGCSFNGTKCTTNSAGSDAGGWDGWIKFDKDATINFTKEGSVYNTIIKTEDSKHKILGNAWGGDLLDTRTPPSAVLGEIRVINAETTYNPNNACPEKAPVAEFKLGCRNGDVDYGGICYFDFGNGVNLINKSTDPDDVRCSLNTNIKTSEWWTDDGGYVYYSNGKENSSFVPYSYAEYMEYISLIVKDYQGLENQKDGTFTMRRAIVPNFSCCIKDGSTDCSINGHFKNCNSQYFKDLTVTEEDARLYLRDNASLTTDHTIPAKNQTINSRTWFYNGINVGSGETADIPIKKDGKIILTACDTSTLCNSKEKNLSEIFGKIIKNPDFKEIPFD